LTAGDGALVFTKDLEISFWTVWTLDGFGLRRIRCVRVNQLSGAKLCLQRIVCNSKSSRSCFYGFYFGKRKLTNFTCVLFRQNFFGKVDSEAGKSSTSTMVYVAGFLQFAKRNKRKK
jgi:hypothetical protein